MLRNRICNFPRAIRPSDSDKLESGDDLISHKESVSEELDLPRLFPPTMSCKSRIDARYVARPLALELEVQMYIGHRTLHIVLGNHSSTQIRDRYQAFCGKCPSLHSAWSRRHGTLHATTSSTDPASPTAIFRPVGISDQKLDGATGKRQNQSPCDEVAITCGGPRTVGRYGMWTRMGKQENGLGHRVVPSYCRTEYGALEVCASLLASSRRTPRSQSSNKRAPR